MIWVIVGVVSYFMISMIAAAVIFGPALKTLEEDSPRRVGVIPEDPLSRNEWYDLHLRCAHCKKLESHLWPCTDRCGRDVCEDCLGETRCDPRHWVKPQVELH